MPAAKTTGKDKTLSVGIDLGTSRSAVSSDNGKCAYVESYVGWPKDFVAQKMIGHRVLFGEDALKHRLSLQLTRPLENGVIREGTEKDEESVMELIGHLVDLAEPVAGQHIHAAVGVPAEALKVNRLAIKQAVSKFAEKLIVVSEPFSVAYGLNALDNAMVIDIGAGTVDFCIMHGTMPGEDDQRSLLSAGDYVDQQLFNMLEEQYPQAALTPTMVRRFKEQHGFVGESNKKIQEEIPVHGKTVSFDITNEVRRACESIIPPIAETAMEMIAKFDPEFQAQVRNNVIIAGGGSQIAGFTDFLANAMSDIAPCKFTCVNDPLYAGSNGALSLANDMPAEYWEDL